MTIGTIFNYDTYRIIPDELEDLRGREAAKDESKIKIEDKDRDLFLSIGGRRELWNLDRT